MKRNLYLLSLGLVMCSCTEPGDIVTGHARIVLKNQPAVVEAPAPIQEPVATPAPEPVATPAPVAEEQPALEQKAPSSAEPAPAPAVEKKGTTSLFGQQQKEGSTPVSTAEAAPAPAPKPAPAAAQPRVIKPSVSQMQPKTTTPRGVHYSTPQVTQPAKRTYPIMPGQNRGLKNRYSY